MIRSRPLVPVAVLLMIGIVLARLFNPAFQAGIIALAIVSPFLFLRRTRVCALAFLMLFLGMTLSTARYRINSGHDLRLVLSSEPELATVRGRIVETPSLREFRSGTNKVVYSHATVDLGEIHRDEQWHPITGRVAVTTRGELTEEFFKGRSIELTGVIDLPRDAAAPGLFDYREYLRNLRIFYQLRCDSTNDWQLRSFEKIPITEAFRRWAQAQLQRGLPENDERLRMLWAMTLGLRNSLEDELTDTFQRTGTLHIVAISGLHVACISYLLALIFVRGIGFSRPTGGVIVLLFVWFYTFATGLQSSAIRSAVMATVFILGWVVRRPGDLLNVIAASAVLILVAQPEQLFQASFQLSFSVVTLIGLTVWFFETYYPEAQVLFRQKLLRMDPLLPSELTPAWKKVVNGCLALLVANLVVSLASWIGSLPLTAYYFNTVTPIGMVVNMFAVPLSSVSLASSVLSLLVPPLGPWCNYIAWAFMWHTIKTAEFFAGIPFGCFYVTQPNPLFFVFYFSIVAVLLIPPLRASPSRRAFAISGIALFALLWLGSVLAARPVATVTMLPCVGTPAYLEVTGEDDLLIDSSSDRDAEYMMKRFLRAKGRGSIDRLLLTHGDAQTAGGFDMVWEEFQPDFVFTSTARARSPVYRKAIRLLEENPSRWKTVAAGMNLDGWDVLHPEKGRGFPRADDNCVVLRRVIAGWSVLHLSELGARGQQALLESGAELRADIVFAGMPEAGEPLNAELLAAIEPRVIILGTTRYPYTAQGTPELRARLESTGADIFYTTEEDAATVTFRESACEVRGMNGQTARLEKHEEAG